MTTAHSPEPGQQGSNGVQIGAVGGNVTVVYRTITHHHHHHCPLCGSEPMRARGNACPAWPWGGPCNDSGWAPL